MVLLTLIDIMNRTAHKNAHIRADLAMELLRCCRLCPRRCDVDRTKGEVGFCGLDDSVRCFREMMFYGEEEGLNPSHQVYFAGCNLQCEFCTVAEWNEYPQQAESTDIKVLAERIADRRAEGAKTLNLLGGEPAVNIYGILKLLEQIEPSTRVVWNSNMYYSDTAGELISGLVDIYLADFKCGNDNCSEVLLGAGDYVNVVKRNLAKAAEHGDVIVRHLVMPGHIECCLKPILHWLATETPDVKLSLRGDYIPPARAVSAPRDYVSENDMRIAVDSARELGLNVIDEGRTIQTQTR